MQVLGRTLGIVFLLLVDFSALTLSATERDAATTLFEAGRTALAEGDMELALSRMEAALRARPDDLRFGSEYRQAVIAADRYERAVEIFEELVALHPEAANTRLNLGYAVVDQIPDAGAVTRVLLANSALGHFTAALAIEESWLGYYTRGNSYLYWPVIFGRTSLAIADLEKAIEISQSEEQAARHAKPWVALGDAYWRLDKRQEARLLWRRAGKRFPDDAALALRLGREAEAVTTLLGAHFDSEKRVDTDLSALWSSR
jgi:tetratricopeptide (TPR) repeat protein